jgi:hypothetical protein
VRLLVEELENREQLSAGPLNATLTHLDLTPVDAFGITIACSSTSAPVPSTTLTATNDSLFTQRFTSADVGLGDSSDSIVTDSTSPDVRVPAPTPTEQPLRRELVLVELDVPDREELIRNLLVTPEGGTALEVIPLQGGGIDEITQVIRAHAGLDAIHIISHGAAGSLDLGSEPLDSRTIQSDAGEIRSWSASVNPGADLLLYGCDFAANADGRTIVSELRSLSGADVAASTDITGSTALGGNWSLEYWSGSIETRTLHPRHGSTRFSTQRPL